MRTLICGGTIADGSGAPLYRGDVLVEGGRIAAVGPACSCEEAQIVHADGLLVCPAFVDIHRHLDAKPLLRSPMESELRQGIATAVAGNCGFSLAPLSGPHKTEKRENDLPILGAYPQGFSLRFPEYLDALEHSAPALNTAAMIGLGAVRICLSGFSDAPLSEKQLADGAAMIEEALQSGAAGVSAGIMYLPEFYTKPEEYSRLLRALRGGKKPLVTHIRGEGDTLVASVAEVLRIAREAECPLEISHFKSCGMRNWGREIHAAIELIERARSLGQDVTVDFYPYDGGSTALTTMLPPAFVQGDMQRALRDLGTQKGLNELRAALALSYPDWDNYAISLGWDRILIASAEGENRRFLGLSVAEAAERFGFADAAALAAHLMHSENGRTAIINLSMDQGDIDAIARLPYSCLISDAIYADTDTPHPRMHGAFPRFFEEYVRRRKVLGAPEAIRKMTSMPAERIQLAGRGRLQPGCFADIALIDPDTFGSDATFSSPAHMARGLAGLLVNGSLRVRGDELTGAPSGMALRVR
ncbi:MAG: amidohydrolase family protein [Eubacteriales bacterium]|nr:amidohydrolase family protein [Eubacteriales bacterium]